MVWFLDEFAFPILEPAYGELLALDWDSLASDEDLWMGRCSAHSALHTAARALVLGRVGLEPAPARVSASVRAG